MEVCAQGLIVNDTHNDIVKVEKEHWPRTPVGTIDWEVVFEDPANGLIPALSVAQKPELLIDCAAVITEALFSRRNDDDIRAGYTSKLASIAINNANENTDVVLGHITTFLRAIKDDRIERAADWTLHKARRDADTAMETASEELPDNQDPNDLTQIFADLFCDLLDRRFQVLWTGVPQELMNGRKIPYVLCAEFSLRMVRVVRTEFMPIVIPKCRHIISAAERGKPEERKKILQAKLANDMVRKELWAVWTYAWRNVMEESEFPEKPEIKPTGMLGSLVKAVQAIGDAEQDDALEAWREDVKIAEIQQATVHEIWNTLTAPSPLFEVPNEEDKAVLRDLFARTPGGLRDQIAALRQISQQSSSVGQAFDIYAKGKDLQLALLSISYQHPDTFLQGNRLLKDMLRGMTKQNVKSHLPLIDRYLADFI